MTQNFIYEIVKKNNVTKRLFIGYFIAFAIIFYFTFFTLFGDKGLVTLHKLSKEISQKDVTKEELSAKMRAKKNMVEGMNQNSLDIDLLDEQARKTLGYAGKNEVVIYQDKKHESEK